MMAVKAGLCAVVVALLSLGCDTTGDAKYTPPPLPEGGGDAMIADATVDAPIPPPLDASPPVDAGPCTTGFRYAPPPGTLAHQVSVTGEWNAFAQPGVPMVGPDASGAFTASVELPPGLVAYKFVVDGAFSLDPAAVLEKYVGGVENSAVEVSDCRVPTLALSKKTLSRAAAGQGHFNGVVRFNPGQGGPGADAKTVNATLRKDGIASPLAAAAVDPSGTQITVDAPGLGDGKYTIFVDASDTAGRVAATLRLVFWIEADAFDWSDSLIYMAVTDRFKDGDTTNDVPPVPNVDPREQFQGGDLEGIQAKVDDGTFDRLGVRVLWMTPHNTNPSDAWIASDGVHLTMGYHGYWPTKAREVDPRLGGDKALHDLVTSAHAHGVRVLEDLVVNHVHQEHEYVAPHPGWFHSGCICGTANCDWTVHRLDCIFAPYLPDIDWTNPTADRQFDDDALWWADTFDLDGFRIDAVKQVPNSCIINLSHRIRSEFEAAGTRFFMTGETAMGWSDCGLSCNLPQYQTISQYIGPHGLDGQFDFPLYYADPLNVFVNDTKGMIHADYWVQASGWEYPAGAIMSPYIGSQDTARFVTLASYRGQDAAHDPSIPYNQWTNIAGPPPDSEPYQRLQLAQSWLFTLPGAPLLYYGDEYGEPGGVDPNNRVMWQGDGALSADQAATLAHMQALGQARKGLVALRRGAYRPVNATETTLVFARETTAGDVALVALSKLTTPTTFTAALPVTLPVPDGTVLHDRMGGADVQVSGGTITVTLGPRGAAVLAP